MFNKEIYLAIIFSLISAVSMAQSDPVHWHFSVNKIADRNYELHFTANVDKPWHIYAQDNNEDLTRPTTIIFNRNPLTVLKDKTREIGKLISEKVNTSGFILKYYENQIDFIQVVTLKVSVKTNISGTIDYMACTDGHCLPPAQKGFFLTVGGQ